MRIEQNRLGGGCLLGNKAWGRLVGGAGAALGLLAVMMLCPAPMEGVNAEEATIKASVTVQPVLGLAGGSDNYVVNVTPTETGEFSSRTATVEVTTNNETGYSLYLATENQQATLANAEGTAEIAPVSGEVMATGFGANTWGYNLGKEVVSEATMYQAVPTQNGEPAGGSEVPVEGDEYNLTFGAFVNTELPGGAYSNRVVVSAVVNPGYVPSLSQIDNMQEMTAEICQASTENETKRLTDTRDGKKYWVTKLADGNCWMTQNLDLDLSTSKALTPEDSNVSRSWTPDNNTLTDGTQTTTDYTAVWSWNLGDYVLTTPNAGTSCGTTGKSDVGDCTSVGFRSVAGMTPMTDGDATDVISGNTYNAHYHVGNHYTWNAATAGTGGTITSTDATDSICPKGWQLPTSNNSNSGSFQALTNAYSISNNTDGSTALISTPLYFVRSGYVASGSLRLAGDEGDYWSSTAYSNTSLAYGLYFYSGRVYPSTNAYRHFGRSVRCLASQ